MPDTATATPDPTDIDAYLSKRGMMTYPQIDAKRQELIGQYETAGEKESAGIEQGAAARKKLMGGGIPSPAAPKLQDLPAPPDNQPQSPFQAFGSPAVFLASIGSLFTRHPLKVAMDSAAAAMKGYHEGDQQAAQAQQERWKEATETAVKQNQIELDKYNAAWKSTEHDVAERQAKMQAIAAGVQDEVMLAAIKTGNLDRVWHMLDSRQQANDKLQEAILRERDRQEGLQIQRDRLSAQLGDKLSDDAIHNAALTWIKTGKMPPNLGRGIQGSKNMTAIQNEIANVMQEQGKTPDEVAEAQRSFQTRAAGLRALETRRGRLLTSIYSTDEMGDLLKKASDAAPRTQFTIINRGLQNIEAQTSDPRLATFVAAINSYANMYAQAIAAGGPPKVSDKEHIYDMINKAMGTGAIDAVVDQIHKEIRAEMRSTRKALKELSTDEDVDTDDTEGTKPPSSKSSSEAPPASMLQEGTNTTFSNGQVWTLQNGKPVKVK